MYATDFLHELAGCVWYLLGSRVARFEGMYSEALRNVLQASKECIPIYWCLID